MDNRKDIASRAQALVDEEGADAERVAFERVLASMESGDVKSAAFWLRVGSELARDTVGSPTAWH